MPLLHYLCGETGNLKNWTGRTATHLMECCFKGWNVTLRSKKAINVSYFGFAKASDSVVHSKLIAKLACHRLDNIRQYCIDIDDRICRDCERPTRIDSIYLTCILFICGVLVTAVV